MGVGPEWRPGGSLGANGHTAVVPSGGNVHGAVIPPGANGHYGYFGNYTHWNYTGHLGTTCRGIFTIESEQTIFCIEYIVQKSFIYQRRIP